MSENNINKLVEMFAVSVSGAKRLLNRSDENLDVAISMFKTEMLDVVIRKLNFEFSKENVVLLLAQNRYDVSKTIECIFEEKHTLTERILLRNEKSSALDKIMYVIEVEDNLNREFWLNLDDLQKLNPYRYCFATILEWSNFASWEGFDYAVSNIAWTKVIIVQIRNNLKMYNLADVIEDALMRTEKHYDVSKNLGQALIYPELEEQADFYEKNEKLLICELFNYVKANVNHFPLK